MEIRMMTHLLGGPMSSRGRFQLWVDGEASSKEIGNIIRILELQRSWLLEDGDHEAEQAARLAAEDADAGPAASDGEAQATEPNSSAPPIEPEQASETGEVG